MVEIRVEIFDYLNSSPGLAGKILGWFHIIFYNGMFLSECKMKKVYARYFLWTTHNQITPVNGTNVIIRLISQNERKYKLKYRYYWFLWSIWNFKMKLLKSPLSHRRESHWLSFADTMVYSV